MAVNKRSRTIVSGTADTMNLTSDPVPGDSYLGHSDGLHTIQAVYKNFQGRFEIQATLAIEPDESDWFTVNPNVFLYSEIDVPPTDPEPPIGEEDPESSEPDTSIVVGQDNPEPTPEPVVNPGGLDPRFRLFTQQFSGSEGYTFSGNFAWIRVVMDRTDFGDGETYQYQYGEIARVILSS